MSLPPGVLEYFSRQVATHHAKSAAVSDTSLPTRFVKSRTLQYSLAWRWPPLSVWRMAVTNVHNVHMYITCLLQRTRDIVDRVPGARQSPPAGHARSGGYGTSDRRSTQDHTQRRPAL